MVRGLLLGLVMDTGAQGCPPPPAIAQGEGMMGRLVKGKMEEDSELD